MTKHSFSSRASSYAVLVLAAVLASGCTAERVCDDGACDSPNASPEESSQGNTPEAGEVNALAEAGSALNDAADAPPSFAHDAAPSETPSEVVTCRRDSECPDSMVCSSERGHCVMCTSDGHCEAPTSYCAPPGAADAHRCVECNTSEHCSEGVCADHRCRACNPETSEGCEQGEPFCVEPGDMGAATDDAFTELACVACVIDEHCDEAPLLTCESGLCVACDISSDRGCEQGWQCVEARIVDAGGQQERRCVECMSTGDCSPETPYCVNDRCTECEPSTHEGCDPIKPWCLPPTHEQLSSGNEQPQVARCYECASDQDCASDELSQCVRGTCVACASNDDCRDPAASYCDLDSNECVACSTDTHCSHLTSTSVCHVPATQADAAAELGRCVQCTATDRSACGDAVCQTVPGDEQYQCTDQAVDQVGLCRPCVSDAQCTSPAKCVELSHEQEGSLGWFCLQQEGAEEDLEECELDGRPFSVPLETHSVDGADGTFCAPITTCQAFTDYLEECETDSDCGAPGIDDGVCAPNGSSRACTYPCRAAVDCSWLVACSDDQERVCSF